jgi:hypothetical protein
MVAFMLASNWDAYAEPVLEIIRVAEAALQEANPKLVVMPEGLLMKTLPAADA